MTRIVLQRLAARELEDALWWRTPFDDGCGVDSPQSIGSISDDPITRNRGQ